MGSARSTESAQKVDLIDPRIIVRSMSERKAKQQRRDRKRREMRLDELGGIVERARSAPLSAGDYDTLKAAIDTLAFLTQEIEHKGTTIDRLRRMLFGARTEKTEDVVGGEPARDGSDDAAGAPSGDGGDKPKPKKPGHGRNGAAAYPGAQRVKVPLVTMSRGDACPCCTKGKVYPLAEPRLIVRIEGMAPIGATVYEKEGLRCNLCGEVFVAPSPEGIGEEKYDETAPAMVALLKYGAGVPFYRIETLQQGMGIPLPAATQWDLVFRAAQLVEPAYEELVNQAAQGDIVHNDDTTAKILELSATPKTEDPAEREGDERTGVFTSGIISEHGDHRIAVFATGKKHAGENLADVLSRRAAELAAPIQMCDALSRNLPGELSTIVAHCLAHARRKFVDVVNDFPDEVKHLLEALRVVYHNDALARQRGLSPEERLAFHQTESGPVMTDLEAWLAAQIDEKKVEPNSGLGQAIGYMQKHWSRLTLFLRVAGAPLDNNVCERALKKAILHRKNALFFKTQNGARVGDRFMSLIHTAELNGQNPFDYLVALQRHTDEVAAAPAEWMPWNYRDALARLAGERAPPG
jgi:transposase